MSCRLPNSHFSKAVRSSDTSVVTCHSTRRNIKEEAYFIFSHTTERKPNLKIWRNYTSMFSIIKYFVILFCRHFKISSALRALQTVVVSLCTVSCTVVKALSNMECGAVGPNCTVVRRDWYRLLGASRG
jgi:hypothetical protein